MRQAIAHAALHRVFERPTTLLAAIKSADERSNALLHRAPRCRRLFQAESAQRLAREAVEVDTRAGDDDAPSALFLCSHDDPAASWGVAEACVSLGTAGAPRGDIVPTEDTRDVVTIISARPRVRRTWRTGEAVQTRMSVDVY